jgi:hypothetical protein
MPVLTSTFAASTHMFADILEDGADRNNWYLASDARIKSEENSLGIGPVVYRGRPKNGDGDFDKDGQPRDALLMFVDEADAVYCIHEGQDPVDIADTIADFMTNHGGDLAAMKAKRPS